MTNLEALKQLILVAPIDESTRARLLSALPDMHEDDVLSLGKIFAKQEHAFGEKLTAALTNVDAFLTQTSSTAQTPDATEE